MNINYFQGRLDSPYHISIGAVVVNGEGKICCHYFDKVTIPNLGTFENLNILMRETLEQNETIENCLARGLMEEFGMKAILRSFVGSIVSHYPTIKDGQPTDVITEKTTLYFLCDFISIDEASRNSGEDDPEAKSDIQWVSPLELIQRMKEQGERMNREDADESVVVERAFDIINKTL